MILIWGHIISRWLYTWNGGVKSKPVRLRSRVIEHPWVGILLITCNKFSWRSDDKLLIWNSQITNFAACNIVIKNLGYVQIYYDNPFIPNLCILFRPHSYDEPQIDIFPLSHSIYRPESKRLLPNHPKILEIFFSSIFRICTFLHLYLCLKKKKMKNVKNWLWQKWLQIDPIHICLSLKEKTNKKLTAEKSVNKVRTFLCLLPKQTEGQTCCLRTLSASFCCLPRCSRTDGLEWMWWFSGFASILVASCVWPGKKWEFYFSYPFATKKTHSKVHFVY